ncbi:uncharacterized protein [Ptychodera flava]|uniref:uncharacterized protein n=1 Tax=Ptychodera flava TaxID=63121 RepID=UPI003969DE65
MAQRGQLTLEEVREAIRARRLLKPREIMGALSILDIHEAQKTLITLYDIAKARGNWGWVRLMQEEADVMVDVPWIVKNMPHINPKMNVRPPKPRKQAPVDSNTDPYGMCRDIRLQTRSDLTVYREGMPASGEPTGHTPQPIGEAQPTPTVQVSEGIDLSRTAVTPSPRDKGKSTTTTWAEAPEIEVAAPDSDDSLFCLTSEEDPEGLGREPVVLKSPRTTHGARLRFSVLQGLISSSLPPEPQGEQASTSSDVASHPSGDQGRTEREPVTSAERSLSQGTDPSQVRTTAAKLRQRLKRQLERSGTLQSHPGDEETNGKRCREEEPHSSSSKRAGSYYAGRPSPCPFPGCRFESKGIKEHCFRKHLPRCLREDPGRVDYNAIVDLLEFLTRKLVGPNMPILALYDHLKARAHARIPEGAKVTDTCRKTMEGCATG